MDNNQIIEEILQKLDSPLPHCRICLENAMDGIEFDEILCIVNGEGKTYWSGLQELMCNNNDLPNNLPSNFCTTCANDLRTTYLFLQKVEQTNELLRNVSYFIKQYTKANTSDLPNDNRENYELEIVPFPKEENQVDVELIQSCEDYDSMKSTGPFAKTDIKIELQTDVTTEDETLNTVSNGDEMAWICEECGVFCDSLILIEEHKTEHHSKKVSSFECCYCEEVFLSVEQLNEHNQVHQTKDEAADCYLDEEASETDLEEDYDETYRFSVDGSKTITSTKAKDKNKCSICNKTFATQYELKRHTVSHKKRIFFCHICTKLFTTRFTLNKHIKSIHQSNRLKYQCEDCGLIFQYPSHLRDHQKQHNTTNLFQCPHCDRSYARKPQFDVHMRYHNNDFPFKCDQCDKCYVTKSNLKDHIRSRHAMITYNCDKCAQKFKSTTGLRKHRFIHTGYPYICPVCNAGHTSRSGMKSHLFAVHKDAYKEEEFNEMFPIIVPKSGYRRPKVQIL